MRFWNRPIENWAPHIWLVTLPAHGLGLFTVATLFWSDLISPAWWLATLVGWILISGFGIAIGFHRLLSHNSFQTSTTIKRTLAFLGCLGGQGSPLFWVCLHRGLRHPFADTQKDIHSPIHGKWQAYMGWQLRLNGLQLPFRCTLDLQKDAFIKFLHQHYYYVLWGTALILVCIDFRILLMGLMLPMIIAIHTENLVDLFCHLPGIGYRNHELSDQSRNVWWLGYLGFGQGWHNNHHARPSDYDFGGEHWYEIDPCRWLIAPLKSFK